MDACLGGCAYVWRPQADAGSVRQALSHTQSSLIMAGFATQLAWGIRSPPSRLPTQFMCALQFWGWGSSPDSPFYRILYPRRHSLGVNLQTVRVEPSESPRDIFSLNHIPDLCPMLLSWEVLL